MYAEVILIGPFATETLHTVDPYVGGPVPSLCLHDKLVLVLVDVSDRVPRTVAGRRHHGGGWAKTEDGHTDIHIYTLGNLSGIDIQSPSNRETNRQRSPGDVNHLNQCGRNMPSSKT